MGRRPDPGARTSSSSASPAARTSCDKDKPVIFQCRVGRRSALATQAFRAVGFDAYNMRGGIQAWAEEGLPLEPEDGTVADH